MKIGIIADTHFGAKWNEDAYNQGREALLSASKECDMLIIPGDVFDKNLPGLNVLNQAVSIFTELRSIDWKIKINSADMPIAVIHGNHERRTKGNINPVQLLQSSRFFVDVHNNPTVFELNGEKVMVHGLGSVPDDYAKIALGALNLKPVGDCFNIFIFHQTMSEFVPITTDLMTMEDLPPGFDLYICGHIHKKVEVKDKNFLIPGSTVLTQMKKEEQETKGYFVYDTIAKDWEFKPIKCREFTFVELEFNDATPDQINNAITSKVDEIHSAYTGDSYPLIRFVLKGSLRSGLKKSDLVIDLSQWDGHVFVDRKFEFESLKSTVETLRELKNEKSSIKELGTALLVDKLKRNKCRIENPVGFFNCLVDDPDNIELVLIDKVVIEDNSNLDSTKSIEKSKSTGTDGAVENGKLIENNETVENNETNGNGETVGNNEPVGNGKPIENGKPINKKLDNAINDNESNQSTLF